MFDENIELLIFAKQNLGIFTFWCFMEDFHG